MVYIYGSQPLIFQFFVQTLAWEFISDRKRVNPPALAGWIYDSLYSGFSRTPLHLLFG